MGDAIPSFLPITKALAAGIIDIELDATEWKLVADRPRVEERAIGQMRSSGVRHE